MVHYTLLSCHKKSLKEYKDYKLEFQVFLFQETNSILYLFSGTNCSKFIPATNYSSGVFLAKLKLIFKAASWLQCLVK